MKQSSLLERDTNRDTNRDIQECLCSADRDGNRDKTGEGIGDTHPNVPIAGGHVPFVPSRMSRQQRRQSFAAWVNAGRPWPPPLGLVSSCLTPLVRARRERW
jgi:hypothetical protein